ncbi:rhomboid family intramembrane serine protease [Oricola indica]|jgi:membrane associated rhomboid family serine protease|uniref:rhomboid family intramembrane serine protease n=1 Tax=Oricola indica TaxID=2872591 RepID=UPI001CBB19F6|nr:rhomboid family intramembrane serine protease [Oricola indica]
MNDPAQTDATPNETSSAKATDRTGGSVPAFNLHGSIVLLAAICIAVHFIRTMVLSDDENTWLLVKTAFFPLRYSPEVLTFDLPTLISPVTYAFLHGDWVHLGVNVVWLSIFGSPLAYRIGWRRSILFWVVTAAAAAATHLVIYFNEAIPVIGASGAVSGFMGAAARFGLRANRREPRRGFDGPLLTIRQTLRTPGVLPFLLIWVVVNIFVGVDPFGAQDGAGIAWQAHIGGLVAGFLLVPLFDRRS